MLENKKLFRILSDGEKCIVENNVVYIVNHEYAKNGDFCMLDDGSMCIVKHEDENELVVHCLIRNNIIVGTSLKLKGGQSLKLMSEPQRWKVLSILINNCYKWDAKDVCLYKYRERVPFNEQYFFINNDCEPQMEIELHTIVDNKRYKCGNYFLTKQDALMYYSNLCNNQSPTKVE